MTDDKNNFFFQPKKYLNYESIYWFFGVESKNYLQWAKLIQKKLKWQYVFGEQSFANVKRTFLSSFSLLLRFEVDKHWKLQIINNNKYNKKGYKRNSSNYINNNANNILSYVPITYKK